MPSQEQLIASLPLSPIQLRKYDIGEVVYSCQGFSNSAISPASDFQLDVGVSDFVEEDRTLQVTLTFSCSSNPPDSPCPHPYSLKMAVHGEFFFSKEVEKMGMGKDKIIKWGNKNAVVVLMPFLREAVYSFTQKTGFKPMMMPLLDVSAFTGGIASVKMDSSPPQAAPALRH